MKRVLILFCFGTAFMSLLCAEEIANKPATSSDEAISAAVPAGQLVLNGRIFHQAETTESPGAKTVAYLPEGATLQDWAEMITHQLLTLQQRAGADEVVQFIRRRSEGKIRIETILETRKATVFLSLSPGVDGAEAQMAVSFAFLDLTDPLKIHLVQFVLKPNRLPQTEVEQKLRSWRDLFKDRATSLATS